MTNEQDHLNLESFDADQTVCEADMTREILSAYLDGELDDSTRRELETRLVSEPALQKELTALERTWNLLDTLESEEVQESFSQSTLELVSVSASQELEQQQSESIRGQRRRWAATVSGLVTMIAIGFLLVALLYPRPNDDLLTDVPILVHLDAYCLIDDVAFLERLHEEGLFAEPSQVGSQPSVAVAAESSGSSASVDVAPSAAVSSFREVSFSSISSQTPLDVRRGWIEALPVEDKYELHRAYERFQSMTEEEQSALRDLYEAIDGCPDANALLGVMLRYHDWLSSLTKLGMSGERSQLARLSLDERIEKIRELQEQQAERSEHTLRIPGRFFLPPEPLQSEDISVISPLVLAASSGLIEQWKERFAQPDRDQSEAELREKRYSSDTEIRQLMGLRFWIGRENTRSPMAPPVPENQSSLFDAPLMSQELREIREKLSPETQTFLEDSYTEAQQWRLLVDMVISDHMMRTFRRRNDPYNNAKLADFLENEMEPDDREMLLALPSADEMYSTMIRLYYGLSTRQGVSGGHQFPFSPGGPGPGGVPRGPGSGMGPGGMGPGSGMEPGSGGPGGGMRDGPGQGRGGMGMGSGRVNGPNGQSQGGPGGLRPGQSGGPPNSPEANSPLDRP